MAKLEVIEGIDPRNAGRPATRLLLRARLADVRRFEDAARSFDMDGVHDLRVATRRLRAALQNLGADEALDRLERRLEALQDSLGALRDAQIQLRWLRRHHG